ncbi:hypothetical protein COE29_31320, partial [Bacillus cereus]
TALPVTPLPARLGSENANVAASTSSVALKRIRPPLFSSEVAMHEQYQPREIEAAAQSFWDEQKSFEVGEQPGKETYY